MLKRQVLKTAFQAVSFMMTLKSPALRDARADAIVVLKPEQLEKFKDHPTLKTKTVPRREYLTTVFPYRGRMSVLAGLMKVYPIVRQVCKRK